MISILRNVLSQALWRSYQQLPVSKDKPCKQGETPTELFIRIESLVEKLEKLKPTGKEVSDDMFVSIFLNALPKDFSYILQEADLKKPLTVCKKALKNVASHT